MFLDALPPLSIFTLCGWVVVPVMFPAALPVLIVVTAFFIWTKLTETIVTTRGHLPSIYQCYFKVFNCCRKNKLNADEVVPKISSEACDVLFSLQNIYDFDNFATPYMNQATLSPALQTAFDASINVTSSSAKMTHQANDSSIRNRKNVISVQSETNETVEIPESIQHLLSVTSSAVQSLPHSFYTVPVFNMDLSIMVFTYFPLSVWSADLVKTDLTVFFNASRKSQFSFSSRVAATRFYQGDVHIDIATEVTTYADSVCDVNNELMFPEMTSNEETEDTSRRTKSKRAPKKRTNTSTALVATVVNTYCFPRAAADCEGDEGCYSSTTQQIIKQIQETNKSEPVLNVDYVFPQDTTGLYAGISGNLHPRHLNHSIVSSLGVTPNKVDLSMALNMLVKTLSVAAGVDSDDKAYIGASLPYRMILEAEAELYTATDLRLNINAPTDTTVEITHPSFVAAGEGETQSYEAYPQFNQARHVTFTVDAEDESVVYANAVILSNK